MQDIYLTGNPQVTFFKVVYRRHTNFAIESIQQTFNGATAFGRRVTTQISRNGDLIHRMYLEVTLPALASTSSWVEFPGLRLISDVELDIGGQHIDKQYCDFMYIWNELSLPLGKRNGYNTMVGEPLANLPAGVATPAGHLYIPLEFWFCRNVGLALPLIALQYHEVKINITFANPLDMLDTGGRVSDIAGDIGDASLWVDYIFLDTDERRRFAQLSHEYLIEQIQWTNGETINGQNAAIKLTFNHPTKELIWVVRKNVNTVANKWTNYSDSSNVNNVMTAKLQLNGQDRFYVRQGSYFNLVQPFQHHENVSANTGINVYSFALKPEEHQPSGTLNFSRIDTAVLQLGIGSEAALGATLNTYAVSYNVLRIMSGMGGLALTLWCVKLSIIGIGHKSYALGFRTQKNRFVASGIAYKLRYLQDTLLFGKPLRAVSTKACRETTSWPRIMNLGVKMTQIGQPACLSPNPALIGHGEASETERASVVNDGIINHRRLKIQSIPLRKLRGTEIPTRYITKAFIFIMSFSVKMNHFCGLKLPTRRCRVLSRDLPLSTAR
jgi:hypothetical protein